MNEKIDESIVNCLRTVRGSMPMFRRFGLDATDSIGRIKPADIQEQLARFYPDAHDLELHQTSISTYTVSIKGAYDETK